MVDNKQIKQINKYLQKQIVQRYGVFAVAFLVISSVAYVGTQLQRGSNAAALPATLTVTPASASAVTGTDLAVTIVADSSTDTINSVQASLAYNPAHLQYVSMTEGTAFPVVAATSTATAGVIRVARGTQAPTTVSGSNTVVTVNFRVIGSGVTSPITFDPAFSYIVRSTDNVNVLASTTGGNFTLRLPAPSVTAASPASGPIAGGNAVTVTGNNFVSGARVSFGGTPATNVTFVNSSTLTATVPAHAAGSVNVEVFNPDQQSGSRAAGYTYVAPAPTLSSVAPTSGTTAGGTAITVTGTNFTTGAVVKIGGVNAASTTFVSPTTLTAVTAAKTAGTNSVTVTNVDNQSTPINSLINFTYVIPAPTISTVAPISGPTTGGTVLTITGTNFAGVTGVTVGGVAATSVDVSGPTTLTAVTPSRAAGLVDVTVTNTSGTATKTGAFTYRLPAPAVTSVTPNSGTANGGTRIVVRGTNFASGATVTVGGVSATNIGYIVPSCIPGTICDGSIMISATAPAHAAGIVDVVVTNPDTQSGRLAGAFTYLPLGDANNDGRVNAIDLSILISNDGQNYSPADFNGDGTVGSADLAILLGRWTW